MLATKYFFQEAQTVINEKLRGLPSFCRLLMLQSLQYCDIATGKIILPSLEEFAEKDFYISAAPGRKREMIDGEVLRNAFRTIKKCAHAHFIFSRKNQRIEIELPFIRHLYEKSKEKMAQDERYGADAKEQEPIEKYHKNHYSTTEKTVSDVREDAEGSSPNNNIKNINIFNKNNNNNSSCEESICKSEVFREETSPASTKDFHSTTKSNFIPKPQVFSEKTIIPDNFCPNETTVKIAKARGYKCVSDKREIQNFIAFNKAIGSRWADFNFVYLKWLAKREEVEAKAMAKVVAGEGYYRGRTKSHATGMVNQTRAAKTVDLFSKEENHKKYKKTNNVITLPVDKREEIHLQEEKPNLIRYEALIEENLTTNQLSRIKAVVMELNKTIKIDDVKALEEEISHCLLNKEQFKVCGNDFGRKLNAIRKVILRGDWQRPASMVEEKKEEESALINPIDAKLKDAWQDLRHFERMLSISKSKGFHDSDSETMIRKRKADIARLETELKQALIKLKEKQSPFISN